MSEGERIVHPVDQELFRHLLASKPPKEPGAAAAATTFSVIFHGAIIAAAVVATLAVGKEVAEEEKAEEVTFIKIEEAPPPPPPPEQAPPPPKPKGFQTLAAPDVIPVDIPPPDTIATVEEDFSGEGAEGGSSEGTLVDTTQTFLQGQVSVIPKMIKVVKPVYPESLKKLELEGTVVLQAIIKTDGRVDPASVKVIKKLHPQLDQASMDALVATEFSPALFGAQAVRVIMQIPYTFKFR